MRTSPLFLGSFALAVLLLLLLACASPDQPTDLPNSERPTGESETQTSPAQTRSTPGSGASRTPTSAPATALPSASGSAETDRATLVALYHATDGPYWRNNTNWLSGEPIGEWTGVTTDEKGRVTKVNLDSNQLSGEIPPHLSNLTNLESMDLRNNQLLGKIPPSWGTSRTWNCCFSKGTI